jgi:hypothetical protein
MYVDNRPELREVHLGESPVAQDAGIIDQNVDSRPSLQRLRDHRLHRIEIGHRRGDRQRLATGVADFLCHLFGGYLGKVVDDDLRAARSQQQRMLAAEPGPCPGDDCHPSRKIDHFLSALITRPAISGSIPHGSTISGGQACTTPPSTVSTSPTT